MEPHARRPLRVSFVLSSLWLSGGVMVVIELANRLAARGHAVSLVAPASATAPTMREMVGAAVRVVESSRGRREGEARTDHVRLALSLARAVPPTDVIIATHTPTTVPAWLAARPMAHAARLWLFMDYAGMFAGRKVEGWLLRNAGGWQDAALTISQATAEELRRTTSAPVTCVGWGLSHFERLTPCYLEERPLPGAARLLYVGDDRPRKGMADFLSAAEQVAAGGRAVELQIVCRTGCTVQTSLPYTLHVAASTETLIELYQSCSCLVMASWAERLSNPPLEAMACATPVVLTASGGPEEYARDGENCLVVPPRAPKALAAAIARVLDEPELARRLSHAGPATAAAYRWEPVIDRVEQLLFETTQRRAEASSRRWRSAAR